MSPEEEGRSTLVNSLAISEILPERFTGQANARADPSYFLDLHVSDYSLPSYSRGDSEGLQYIMVFLLAL